MLWLKAFHLVTMIAWFCGLFYLPRLFVYHTQVDPLTATVHYDRFCTMERRLYWGIMTPSAIATLILGGALIVTLGLDYFKQAGWLHAKLTLIFILLAYHAWCGQVVKRFKKKVNRRGAKFYKIANEIPLLFLLSIVLLAVFRPF
ncbi:MAG: CopD family protein [Gammaproteobacteria bacterium]